MRTSLSAFAAASLAFGGLLSAQPQLASPMQASPHICQTCGIDKQTSWRAEPTEAQKEARAFRGTRVSGRYLSRAITKVTKALEWHDDLEEAAQAATEQDKPILWVQALGTLKGFL